MTNKQNRIEKAKKLAALGLTKKEIAAYLAKKPTEEQAIEQGRAIGLESAMYVLKGIAASQSNALAAIFVVIFLRLVPLFDLFQSEPTEQADEKNN
ncbi:MAG: hypothetical protein ACOVQA_04025 [Thermoflexibacteraceae bacterium]|jgi:hypothetical protein